MKNQQKSATQKLVEQLELFIDHANKTMWEEECFITLIKYSGRGMCGEYCWALTAPNSDNFQDFISDFEEFLEFNDEKIERETKRQLRKPSVDNLGHGYVFYWRGIKA